MNRARLKRRISPSKNFGKDGGCRDSVDLKRFRHLTESFPTGHETTKDRAAHLAAGDYDTHLALQGSVATSLSPIGRSGVAVVANLSTCLSPLQSDVKVQNSEEIKSSQQLPKTGKHDHTNSLLNGTRQSLEHDFDPGVIELPAAAFMTDKQVTRDGCAADQLCQICWKDVSCYNKQRRMQHVNQCIDELENAEKEKKHLEEATKHLWIQVLDCPICGKKLKTQNARHLHLKKCAVTFCISPMDLIKLIKKQEQDHQLQLPSSSFREMSEELDRGKTDPTLTKKKQKRVMKNWFKEPHSKWEEDTQLAIALSTSVEDRRNSLVDFVSYTLPPENKPKEEETENIPSSEYVTFCPLPPPSKDALLLLMSQKTKESSLPTKRGQKNKVAKQPPALLALDHDEVKRRLAQKATALVLQQLDFSAFYDAHVPCFQKSKLPAKYSYKRGKDFLWCLASQNMENLCTYYVKELVPAVVPKDAGYSSLQQQHLNWQMSDERLELQSQLNQTAASVVYGSTQTALILAELAADAGTETSFADDFFQKSLSSNQEMQKQPLPSAADAAVATGFCIATEEVCDKTSIDLLNAWSQMVDNACMSDLTLKCRDGEVIRLHRLVLMARYPNLLQIIESESSKVVFSRFSKMAALSVMRFVYSAEADVHHLVVFEAKRLAESLQLTDFCEICENVIKTYDLVESTAPEASAATLEDLVMCGWFDGLDQMQRDKEDSWGGSGKAVEKEEEEKDTDLDEVYTFMLTQRRNQMNGGGITEDEDNERETSKRSTEDNDEFQMMNGFKLCNGSGDEDQDDMLLELSPAASVGEEQSTIISSGKSHKAKSYASCGSAVNTPEGVSVDAQTFPDEILSEKKECSSVHVELFGEKVHKSSDSLLIDFMSENSNRTRDLVAVEDEAQRCLSDKGDDDDDNDDDEKGILPRKSSEEFGCSAAAAELNHDKDHRETSRVVDGSCLSFCILRTDPIIEHPLDLTDCSPVVRFDTSKQGEKEPLVLYTSIVPLKSASSSSSSSSSWYSAKGLVPSSCHASGSSDVISKHGTGLVSSCILSSDSLSPDLFPSSPFFESIVSPVVSVQESCVLLQAAKKLKNVLDTDKVFGEELETSESTIDCARNLLTEGSGRDIERQNEVEYEKHRHISVDIQKNSDSSIYHEKSILETPYQSPVHGYSFSQGSHFDARHQFLSQVAEKLTGEDFLPDIDDDDDDDDDGKVQNPTETASEQNMTSVFLNCNENCVNKDNKSTNNNEIKDSSFSDEGLFPHDMKTLQLSPGVEIGIRMTQMYESFRNDVALHSKSLSSCRINSPVMTYKLEDICQMPDSKTSGDILNAETKYEEYSEKKRQSSFDDAPDSAACDGHHDVDDDHDNENTAQHVSIQCDYEVSAAVLDSNERICDEKKIWENFPEKEFAPHVFFENDKNVSHMQLALTPKSMKMQGHYTAGRLRFSPPTDMETDVSAVMEDIVANSSLLNSDVSFETSSDTARTMVNAKSPMVNTVQQIDRSDIAGTSVLNVTPLPSYGQMNTPALQQHCHDYGIRHLPKKQMVRVLENIYFDLHPGIPKPDTVRPKQNVKKRTKTKVNKGHLASFVTNKRRGGNIATQQNNQTTGQSATVTSSELRQGKSSYLAKQIATEISICSDSESDDCLELVCPKQDSIDDEDEDDNSLKCIPEESVLIQKKKKTKSDLQSEQDDSVKKEILMSFFSKNTDLYQRILNYEPLELDYLKKLLKENEIKVTSHFLIDFLDEQNMLFTTRNCRVGWNSHRLLAKGKVINWPSPQNNVFSTG